MLRMVKSHQIGHTRMMLVQFWPLSDTERYASVTLRDRERPELYSNDVRCLTCLDVCIHMVMGIQNSTIVISSKVKRTRKI